MRKGEKLMRSLYHLFEINYRKIRQRIGFGQVGRHLECLVMTREKVDFSLMETGKEEEKKTYTGNS